ncbi:hypothetical protein O9929_02725 [Vibrio lentus]|nr:hypothetical protein [Vibrio lentus]
MYDGARGYARDGLVLVNGRATAAVEIWVIEYIKTPPLRHRELHIHFNTMKERCQLLEMSRNKFSPLLLRFADYRC